jgi:RNA polymerase sigma-70 factor (ECF subfamily)
MSGVKASPSASARESIPDLLETHGDLVYSLGLRLWGNTDSAADLVQETFMRALNSWDSFEGRSQPSTWLYTIATRTCSRMSRLRAGEPSRMEPLERLLPSGEEGVIQLPSGDDPEEDAARNEAVDAILAAVAQLPLAFRLPFVLKEMADFSVAEVAEVLGLKPATVKTRLHRARLRVRQLMAEALPTRPASPHTYDREECLALLRAKQEAMDNNTLFPLSIEDLCARCRPVFETLDFTHAVCGTLCTGQMPEELRAALSEALASD